KGAEMAVDYLFNSGHQKIAFINGDPEHYNAQERFQGVKKAFKKHKLDLDEKYIIESDFYAEDGYQSMQELLEMPRSQWPSAVFAASDNQAIGAIQALEERALKAPDDIALIGYDNIELAKYLKITTIWQPMYKLGQLTIEVLLKAIEGDLKERFEKELDLSLIKRETA
ncbi:MAG: LacI family transcriptional regulator, partial [Halanaerobium sp. MSAO_Bac5]